MQTRCSLRGVCLSQEGCAWLVKRVDAASPSVSVLADEGGLGRGTQAIAALVRRHLPAGPVLVVVPEHKYMRVLLWRSSHIVALTSGCVTPLHRLFKWQQQLERWARGAVHVRVCAGHNSSLPLFDRPDVCLTTYATVMDCRQRLDGGAWAVLLLDEAHHLGLCAPGRLESVLSLEANHTVVLTPNDVTAHLPAYLLTLMAARDPYVMLPLWSI